MTEVLINSALILRWMELCSATFQEHKDELTQLDAIIGDADHGANMARGFSTVETKLASLRDKDIGTIFKTVAMTLISTVGGASGPLYGTFFLEASKFTAGKSSLTPQELSSAMSAGLEGLMKRGKAAVGEKTMIDALVPAMEALKPQQSDSLDSALSRAIAAAQKGADSTIPLVATKGRASYLGERSAGHKDPGACSSVLLLEALRQAASAAS